MQDHDDHNHDHHDHSHGAGGPEGGGGGGGGNTPSLPPGVDTVCGGCKQAIEHDNGGVVVAFGSSLFHIDCFRCSKCQDRVTADTNLLLLSDGNPVCSNCSYQCFVCKKPIMDEAIMTGDESYHAACFTCRHCNKRIEELVFAKTSQGIYCMSCHNERVAKSRRHAEAKRKQQRKDKEKDKLRENQLQTQQGLPNSSSGYVDSPSSYSLGMPSPTATTPNFTPHPDYFPEMSSPASSAVSPRPSRSPSAQGNNSLNPNERSFASSPQPSSTSPNLSITPRTNTLPLPTAMSPLNGPSGLPVRRSSVDDGSSGKPPMSSGGHTPSVSMGSGVGLGLGLGVPTTKADRRRSINPSTFPVEAVSNVVDSSDRSNNVSASSSLGSLSANSHGHQDGRLTPLPPSPLRTTFDQGANPNRSPSPSPSLLDPSNTAPLNISSRSRSKSRDPINPLPEDPSYFPHPSTSSAPPRTSSLPDSLTSPTLTVNGALAAPSPISPRGGTFLGAGVEPGARSSSPRRREGSSGVPSPDQLHFPSNPPLVAPLPRSPTTTFPSSHLGQPHPPLLRTSSDDRQRAPSDSFNVTFGFENDPPRPSMSSERGTSPTSTFLAPRQRSTSAVSVDPPRLDAHRPVSFLGDDPDFSSMFQRREEQQSSSKSSEVPSTPSTGSTIHDGGDGVGFGRGGGHRSREPSANTDEDEEDPDITISAIEFPSSPSNADSITSPNRPSDSSSRPGGPMTSSSSWTSDKPLPTSPSSNFSTSTTDLSVSLNLRARQDSQGSISGLLAEDGGETMKMLKLLVEKAKEKGEKEVMVSVESLQVLIGEAGKGREKYVSLKGKYDGIKRASARYIEGLTVASDDYEKEVSARREVESEVKRLRAQMHGQTARLSMMDADLKRQDSMQRRSRELVKDMQGLEKDLSKLRAERDLTLAEVEELSSSSKSGNLLEAAKSSDNGHQSSLSRSLSTRLEVVKEQYREELEPLTAERERLTREINELREARETYLEESTTLNARNEELSDLQASLLRQVETAEDALTRAQRQGSGSSSMAQNISGNNGRSFGGSNNNRHAPAASSSIPHHHHPSGSPSLSSLATSTTLHEVPEEVAKYVKVVKPETMEPAPAIRKFKWYKSSKGPESSSTTSSNSASTSSSSGGKQPSSQVLGMVNGKGGKVLYDGGSLGSSVGGGVGGGGTGKEHVFMQHNIPTLRFTRCDHCGDKMWGPIQELRCAGCGTNCHSKCAPQYDRPCNSSSAALPSLDEGAGDAGPPPPSMFGRDLTEQAEADGESIPVIVRKCIAAVDAVGMEYEGIYRKTGGSSQSKHITQLFERGDYDAFDLSDQDTFNDISSVTSVLKNYFRALPDPLLTHQFHEQFVGAAMIRDLDAKRAALLPLVQQLPKAHFDTLRYLMLHLNRVMALQKENLMSARNLGVVFGPTLMRSADRSREFGDMAGKALAIDWLVENAQEAFAPQQDSEA